MSVLRVQQIVNGDGSGPVEFTSGAVHNTSVQDNSLNINTTGIGTLNQIVSDSVVVVGVMTGTFVGNGFNITNPPGTPIGVVIGQHLIT
jgi:hypothetical protein